MKSVYFYNGASDFSSKVKFHKREIWIPPRSPYNLIQELLYYDPWKLLLSTMFLHKSNGKSAIPVFWQFIDKWRSPQEVISAKEDEMEKVLKRLGLSKKRTSLIKRFSEEYITKPWKYPIELHGIGKYGNDSYKIFCVNEWQSVQPNDLKLILYHKWLSKNQNILQNECKTQIDGVTNPKFRKFHTLSAAEEFVKFWKDKGPSQKNTNSDEKLCASPGTSDINTIKRRHAKSKSPEGVERRTESYKKKTENESVSISGLKEKISSCEKKLDFYINGLTTILTGLKSIKNEFGDLHHKCEKYSESPKLKSDKIRVPKPESPPKAKSFAFDSDDGDLFKDSPQSSCNEKTSQGLTIEDFDFSEFDEHETPHKRKRSSSSEGSDKNVPTKKDKKVSGTRSAKDLGNFAKDKDDYVAVYTDGCCLSNGFSGAKAGIGIWFGQDHPLNVSEPLRGVVPTNNNAEIQAARIAMEVALKANISKLKIITDSQFLINSATKWLPKWKLNNWVSSSNKDVVNRVELEKLDKVMSQLSVRWEKVAGHKGIAGNEAADRLANKGAASYVKI